MTYYIEGSSSSIYSGDVKFTLCVDQLPFSCFLLVNMIKLSKPKFGKYLLFDIHF